MSVTKTGKWGRAHHLTSSFRFPKSQREEIGVTIGHAADLAETFITDGGTQPVNAPENSTPDAEDRCRNSVAMLSGSFCGDAGSAGRKGT